MGGINGNRLTEAMRTGFKNWMQFHAEGPFTSSENGSEIEKD